MFFKKKSSSAVTSGNGRYRQVPRAVRQAPNSTVFSYHASSRSAREVSPNRRGERPMVTAASKERRLFRLKWFRRSPLIGVLLIVLLITALNMPVSSSPKVIAVKTSSGGIFLHSEAAYTESIGRLLGNSFWNSNKLTINVRELDAEIQKGFPELAEVNLSIPFFGTRPTVYIEPTMPALLLTTASTDVYVVDQNGRALLPAGQVPGVSKLKLPVVRDESGLPIIVGSSVLPSSNVSFITEVVGQLRAAKLEVEGLTLPQGTSELMVKPKGVGYSVKFNIMGNAREEVGTYLAVKQQLENDHKTPSSYIDVRVEERAYYR